MKHFPALCKYRRLNVEFRIHIFELDGREATAQRLRTKVHIDFKVDNYNR
jgi:hypothetical protein